MMTRLLVFSILFFTPLYSLSQSNNQLVKIYQPPLIYPNMSQRLGEEGVVEISLSINEQGIVVQTEVIQSSGFSRLDEAGKKFASMMRFKPLLFDENTKVINARQAVRYRLEDGSQQSNQNEIPYPFRDDERPKIEESQRIEESKKIEVPQAKTFNEKSNIKPVIPLISNPQDIKRQKCMRLGLAPGSADFRQCMN
jgi:TonB family protein